jgi:predicted transcriptional regulator
MIKPNLLKSFFDDENTREAFKAFQIAVLEEQAVEAVFSGKDVKGFAEAKKVINGSFDKLKELYDKIEVSEPPSSR